MKVTDALLHVVAVRRSQYPTDKKPEFMLVGRSNVGKSSFINCLINRKNLARISSRPGKTQTLNFYLVNKEFRHRPTEDDLLMYNFLKYYNIPVTVVATKVDKVGASKMDKNKKIILDTLDLVMGDDLVLFSSMTKLGREDVLNKIEHCSKEEDDLI